MDAQQDDVPVGCKLFCRRCAPCEALVWAMDCWLRGWTVRMMRQDLSFPHDFEKMKAVNCLNEPDWLAGLIARGLRLQGMRVTISPDGENKWRVSASNEHRVGDLNKYELIVSDESKFAARYILHALMSMPKDHDCLGGQVVFGSFARLFVSIHSSFVGRPDAIYPQTT